MREEFHMRRALAILGCSERGLSRAQTARELGLALPTIARYSKNYDITFVSGVVVVTSVAATPMPRSELVRRCFETGMTVREAEASTGICAATIYAYARKGGFRFRRVWTKPEGLVVRGAARSEAMASMYLSGQTLDAIGKVFGVTRERVRQIISKYHGLVGRDGGNAVRVSRSRAARRAAKEAACMAKNGCTISQMKVLRRLSQEHIERGGSPGTAPIRAFVSQRMNSRRRRIEWKITLWEWWNFWQVSGLWEKRGRGHGYMMCRFGDTGAYELGNVYIATGVHNSSVQPNNPTRKSHPNHSEFMQARREARAA